MNEDQLDIRVPGEHAIVSESRIWRITTGCDCGVLHPTFVRFAFVSLVPLNYCIFIHDSQPLVFLVILCPPVGQFLNKSLLDISVDSGSARSHLVNMGHERNKSIANLCGPHSL